ncbi:MAG: L,D-transpeptidase, partial [Ilumatobacteraceae bacterium]
MRERLVGPLLVGSLLILGACAGDDAESTGTSTPPTTGVDTTPPPTPPPPAAAQTDPPTTEAPTTEASTTTSTTTTVPPTTVPPTTVPATTAPPATEVPTTPPATEPPPPVPGAPDPACVVVVAPGDSLSAIVAATGNAALSVDGVQTENGLADPNSINAGVSLDICVGNGIDDTTGAPRVPATTVPAAPTNPVDTVPPAAPGEGTGVAAQQQHLNELFAGYGLAPLTVDGQSGRMTQQQLCAARVALGLPISRSNMEPGSLEEIALMQTTSLPIPPGAPTRASRWALIDQTCQIMFTGEGGDRLVFVFGTSTGQSEFPTRSQNASRAFRFDPARQNNGWHDSIDYPVPGDNPLNGNMYKPIYFDGGQAIHGANNVPTSP